MPILANLDAIREWLSLLDEEKQSGHIPLPIVDTMTIYEDREPAIALLAPKVVPGAMHVFVNIGGMLPPDRLSLDSLLRTLERQASEAGITGKLWSVSHAGGLDYDLTGTNTISIQNLDRNVSSNIWGILRAIAVHGANYPDREASKVTASTT